MCSQFAAPVHQKVTEIILITIYCSAGEEAALSCSPFSASTRQFAAGPNNNLWAAHQVDPEYGDVDRKDACSTLVHDVGDLCSPMVEKVSSLV
jgi:hypothetical protein